MLAFEPPDRVVVSWDISPYWQVETNLDHTSEVEVRFVADTPERARVELEHRNIERHGPVWEASIATPACWRPYSCARPQPCA